MVDTSYIVVSSPFIMIVLVRLFGHVLGRLPLAFQAGLGSLLGFVLRQFLTKRRKIANSNISKAFPDLDQSKVNKLVKAHFCHIGCLIVELLSLPAMKTKKWRDRKIIFRGFKKIDEVLASGQGALVLTAHLGNWEIMTSIAALGYPFSALYKAQKNVFDGFLSDLRTQCGLRVHTKDGLKAMIRATKKAELIGVLADQGRGSDFLFFGEKAVFPMGAAAFNVRHKAVAFPVFSIRNNKGQIVVTVHDAIEIDEGMDRTESERIFQENYIKVLEREIRKSPEQYYWVHDIWRDFKES